MTSLNDKLQKLTLLRIFLAMSSIGIVLFLLYAVAFGHIAFEWMCMSNNTERMHLDYFKHVLFAADPSHLYENAVNDWGCFPPFIYMLYWALYRMTAYLGITPMSWRELWMVGEASAVFLYYTIFVLIGMFIAVKMWQKQGDATKLFFCLILSAPFFAGIERGNSVMLVFVLLLVALKWRDSDSKKRRELALIFIAMSAAIKIYPAVFGFLYLKENRWKETIRLLIYGILLFFAPFVFFGGAHGFSLWLANVQNTSLGYSIGRIEYIRGLVMTLSYVLSGGTRTADYLALVLPNIFLIFMLGLFFMTNNDYRKVFYLCAIMTFYPGNAFRYTLCFLSIPLIMFLMEHGDEKPMDKVIAVEMLAFGMLFSIPTVFCLLTNFNESFPINTSLTYVELWCYSMAYLVLGIIVIHELVELIRNRAIDEKLFASLNLKDGNPTRIP